MDSYQWVRYLTPEARDWAHKQIAQELDDLRAENGLLMRDNRAMRAENERLRAAIEQARNYMTYVSKELWDEFLSEWIEK